MNEDQKIEILLREYDALRADIANRNNNTFEVFAAAIGLVIGALVYRAWLLLGIVIILIGPALYFLWRDLRENATRLLQIEDDVNRRAGERLLRWDTQWMMLFFPCLKKGKWRTRKIYEDDTPLRRNQPDRQAET
jgi:hypothetical protein